MSSARAVGRGTQRPWPEDHDGLNPTERSEVMGTSVPADSLSEYEMQRRRTMERNRRKLEELGLVGPRQAAALVSNGRRQGRSPSSKPGETTAGESTNDGAVAVAEPIRRSLRNQGKMPPVYEDRAVRFDAYRGSVVVGYKRPRPPTTESAAVDMATAVPVPPRQRTSSVPLSADSSRNLECDTRLLMKEYLGRRFQAFGKDAVMGASTKSVQPKFSRMSGVTEWENALFLWVNVGEAGGGYTNLFERTPATTLDQGQNPAAATGGTPEEDGFSGTMSSCKGNPKHLYEEENNTSRGAGRNASEVDKSYAYSAEEKGSSPNGNSESNTKLGDRGPFEPISNPLQSSEEEPNRFEQCEVESNTGVEDGRSASATKKGLRMTWFAGSRMTAETAVIQRLLQAGETHTQPSASSLPTIGSNAAVDGVEMATLTNDTTTENVSTNSTGHDSTDPLRQTPPKTVVNSRITYSNDARQDNNADDVVLLFCRPPKEPYVFCGRLGYANHWPDERPVRFLWRLLDADRLAGRSDFEAILGAASATSVVSVT